MVTPKNADNFYVRTPLARPTMFFFRGWAFWLCQGCRDGTQLCTSSLPLVLGGRATLAALRAGRQSLHRPHVPTMPNISWRLAGFGPSASGGFAPSSNRRAPASEWHQGGVHYNFFSPQLSGPTSGPSHCHGKGPNTTASSIQRVVHRV